MPYANEHSCRVRDPEDFKDDTIRSSEIDSGIRLISGKLKNPPTGDDSDSMVAQAYRFKADKYTAKEARKWCKDNDVKCILFEEATNMSNFINMSKIPVLKIYGSIGTGSYDIFSYDPDVISAKMVSDFLDQDDVKEASEIIVKINSPGGDIQEGWAINDLLANSGKKVRTVGEGKVYSIATVIFLAGSEREIMKNADGLIHNPFIPPFTLADQYESDDLEKIAESLRQEEEKILAYYVERTGADESKLAEYMKEDTKLSAEDMLSLGFATKIIEPIKAFAYIKPKNINKMDEKAFFEKLVGTLDKFAKKILNFSRLDPVDLTLTDKDGNEFKVERESGDPAVGDAASPDGTYEMTDGKKIVIANGKITEISGGKTELDLANERIQQLETEIETLKAEKPDAEAAVAAANQRESEARALYDELMTLRNEWKPQGRVREPQFNRATPDLSGIDVDKIKEMNKKAKEKNQ